MANQDQRQNQGSPQQGQQQNQQQGKASPIQPGQRLAAPKQIGEDKTRQDPQHLPQDPNERQIGDKPPQNEQGDPRQLQLENEPVRQQGSGLSNSQRKPTQQGGVTSDQDDNAKGSSSDRL